MYLPGMLPLMIIAVMIVVCSQPGRETLKWVFALSRL
jgi:hypothetical protein